MGEKTDFMKILQYMRLPAPPRSHEAELLDLPGHDMAALAENLADLRAVDRLLGSSALTWRGLWPQLRARSRRRAYSLLDVATGGAAGPQLLAEWAGRRGYSLRPVASDRLADVLRLVRAGGARFPLIQHDALHIPLPDRSVDFATCALALHHFDPPQAAALLRELARVARCGLVVNDLQRSWPAYWGALLLARGPWRAMARHDGPLSVRRAYTAAEARALLAAAGLARARVSTHFPFRMLIVLEQASPAAEP